MEPLASRKRIQLIKDDDKRAKIIECLQPIIFNENHLQQMLKTFEEQIKLANSTDVNDRKKTDLFWENTFVRRLLDGSENGTYLGMDLGGTNFRIVRVDMTNGKDTTKTKYYNLEKSLLTGPSSVMFDYIAKCLASFLKEDGFNQSQSIPLGFTFSFPSEQKSLKHSILSTWTKSITCTDGPGLDSVVLLEEAIQRLGGLPIPVDVVARISDTTGTLLAGNLVDKNCRIGLILGTGSNAAFVEYIKNIEKWDTCYKDNDSSELVVINCEFGAFGDNGCLEFMKTEFDHELDVHSNHPHSYTFEKLYAGHYLGELVRLALVKMVKAGLLFNGQSSDKLMTRWSFTTTHVTAIESDSFDDNTNTIKVLKETDIYDICSDEDISMIREICELMSQRGAYIVATVNLCVSEFVNVLEKYKDCTHLFTDGSKDGIKVACAAYGNAFVARMRLPDKATIKTLGKTFSLVHYSDQLGMFLRRLHNLQAMVTLLNHINLPEVTIAIDGSLYEHHPKYHQHMNELIAKWRPETKTTLKLVKDGSGQGGALVAAIERKGI